MDDSRKAWYLDDSDEDFYEEEKFEETVLAKTKSEPVKPPQNDR